jgi:multiple sugar transport system ATP-binding protein
VVSIELQQVRKSFGGQRVLDGLSLAIADGSRTVLLGASGCGKTTTLRLIAGLDSPDAGTVRLDGHEVTARSMPPDRRQLAMLFQQSTLYPQLTIAQNLAFPLKARGVGRSERATRVAAMAQRLGIVGLLERYPQQLSGGQQQRAGIARALIGKPKRLLLDEPLAQLDPVARNELRELLISLQREEGFAMVYVTHDVHDAFHLGQQIAVMADGQIAQCDRPQTIYDRPASIAVAEALSPWPLQRIDRAALRSLGLFPTSHSSSSPAPDANRRVDPSTDHPIVIRSEWIWPSPHAPWQGTRCPCTVVDAQWAPDTSMFVLQSTADPNVKLVARWPSIFAVGIGTTIEVVIEARAICCFDG